MEKLPNLLVTGSPGVGKHTLTQLLHHVLVDSYCSSQSLTLLDLARLIEEHGLRTYTSPTEFVVQETQLQQVISSALQRGGLIAVAQQCQFMQADWFDLVLVMRTQVPVLYERLAARGYSAKRILQILEAESNNEAGEAAYGKFHSVYEVESNEWTDVEDAVGLVLEYLERAVDNWLSY